MKIKRKALQCIVVLVFILIVTSFLVWHIQTPTLNKVEINDFAKTIEEGANKETVEQMGEQYGLQYFKEDGHLVIYSNLDTDFHLVQTYVIVALILVIVLVVCLIINYICYVNRRVIQPFQRLQNFAGEVANGNLDAPLEMDRENIFGAFTESFDIMREELAIAKENERKANESKKELVASLSHDIKTPLASIKAITELLIVNSKESEIQTKLSSIDQKTEQIEVLVNNLFHATLEELEELKVQAEEVSSVDIKTFLINADSNNRLKRFKIPECLVLCDPLRLQQVFDNIISNSYKYADSAIEAYFTIEYGYLKCTIEDFGNMVSKEELPFLLQKYFRGKNSEGKNGAGIGLYISHYFMEKMDGYLRVSNGEHGFLVTVGIKLV